MNSQKLSSSALTRQLKLENLGLDDEYFKNFVAHNIKNTLYPINGVCYFVGQKGSGKTYLLSAVIQHAFNQKEITRLIYIYADNVDTTIIRAIPRSKILSVPKSIAGLFLEKFLKKKTKYTSCYNLLYSASKLKYDKDVPVKDTNLFIDNLLEQISSVKKMKTIYELLLYANKTIKKYNKGTILTFDNGMKYDIGQFDIKQYDMICIDDIGQFLDLFGASRRSSEIYKYFTITRQNKTAIYLTGQEIKQLPKMLREMLGAVVLLNGANGADLDEIRIPSDLIGKFRHFLSSMKQYEGIVYNFNDKEFEFIRYN